MPQLDPMQQFTLGKWLLSKISSAKWTIARIAITRWLLPKITAPYHLIQLCRMAWVLGKAARDQDKIDRNEAGHE